MKVKVIPYLLAFSILFIGMTAFYQPGAESAAPLWAQPEDIRLAVEERVAAFIHKENSDCDQVLLKRATEIVDSIFKESAQELIMGDELDHLPQKPGRPGQAEYLNPEEVPLIPLFDNPDSLFGIPEGDSLGIDSLLKDTMIE